MSTSAQHVREDLVRHYQWLRQYGLNDSHSGNASVRIDDTVWITPTGACADTLRPAELIACSLNAVQSRKDTHGLKGQEEPKPSLDTPLHLAVYRANPRARAVLHCHGPHTVAMTLAGGDFIPPDFEGQYYFTRIPVIDIPYADYLAEAPNRVAASLAEHPITVVRGHGVYAWGERLNLAYKWCNSLELSARTAWLAQQVGTLVPVNGKAPE